MNVLFFCHDDFTCNSMGQIVGFADALRKMGHACAVAIPGDDRASAAAWGAAPSFRPAIFSDAWEHSRALFPDGRPADVLHAWTPREHVRRAVGFCRPHHPGARLFVHLEDNEEHLLAAFTGEPYERLRAWDDAALAARLPGHLAHPCAYPQFLASADGVTGITAELADFVPGGVPFVELWPGVDFSIHGPGAPDPALRASLGIGPDEKILCYPGSSHFANADEMAALYGAVFALNASGIPCRLVRAGHDTPEFTARFSPHDLSRYVVHLGFLGRAHMPGLLRLADVLVQPGRDDEFNRYRLPSKLPEFLAAGRPVVLPHANVGRRVRPGREALVLRTGEPAEIAARCRQIFTNPGLATRLAVDGAAFARRWFDPVVNARGLARFYRGTMVRAANG